MVRYAFSDPNALKGGTFEPINEGVYELIVKDGKEDVTSTGLDTSKITFGFADPAMGERKVFEDFVAHPKALWRFRQFIEQSTYPSSDIDWDDDFNINPKDLVNARVKALVVNEDYDDKNGNSRVKQKCQSFLDISTPEMHKSDGESASGRKII